MKTTPIFKILSAAVLLAVVFYFVVQGYRYFSDPINTTYVYASREWDAIETEGYLVREEETFHSGLTTLHHNNWSTSAKVKPICVSDTSDLNRHGWTSYKRMLPIQKCSTPHEMWN